MATMLTTGFTSTTDVFDRNVIDVVRTGFTSRELYYLQYFMTGTIDREQYKSAGFSGFAAMPEVGEGAPAAMDTAIQRGTATKDVIDYALGFKVSRKFQRNDAGGSNPNWGLISGWANSLGLSAAETLRVTGANILNRAFNSSFTIGYDSKELCATDHSTAGSTEQNELTTAADLTNSSLDEALYTMRATVDYRGLHAGIVPDLLVVSEQEEKNAWQILNSIGQQGTANNDANWFRGRLRLAVDPTLTDKDAWFLIDSARNPLMSLIRESFAVENYVEQGTRSRVYLAWMAAVFLAKDWYGIFGSPGA